MDRFPKQNQNTILVKTFPFILNIPLFDILTKFVCFVFKDICS